MFWSAVTYLWKKKDDSKLSTYSVTGMPLWGRACCFRGYPESLQIFLCEPHLACNTHTDKQSLSNKHETCPHCLSCMQMVEANIGLIQKRKKIATSKWLCTFFGIFNIKNMIGNVTMLKIITQIVIWHLKKRNSYSACS